ncbi:MAG: hypothetical protein RL385_3051 [Pseudomonadota bacterium]|jgi:hypothetical protein
MQGLFALQGFCGLSIAMAVVAWAPAHANAEGEQVVEPPLGEVAVAVPVPQLRAQSEAIRQWSYSPNVTRRRTDARDMSEGVASALLTVLAQGTRSCACGPRRLRWAWALPIGAEEQHPKLLVAFADPLREPQRAREYVRLALLRYADGAYQVTSSMAFKRPAADSETAYLDIRLHARLDADEDGREDLELLVVERGPIGERCAIARFATASPEAKLIDQTCPAGAFEAEAKSRSLL